MSSQKQVVTVRDLVEEAKKRIVILVICVVGLAYLMSLTSSSVWVNLPAAACLIILLRYFSLDFEMRRKAAAYNSKASSANALSLKKPPEPPKAAPRSDWRSKVNSRVVEDALDHLTRRLISEWVTDLWYSRITPDNEGPEELVFILNGVLGEFSRRFRNVNLIDLLTRDLINIVCRHLELFRECQTKIEKQQGRAFAFEDQDVELRRVMAVENKLHPALFSPESEHKVLQHLVNSLISLTFRPEDLQCAFFRYTARELLACCVMRPVLNLATPRFVNERIEAAVISRIKTKERTSTAEETSQSDDLSQMSPDHFSRYLDPSVTGVELVQLKNEQPKTAGGKVKIGKQNGTDLSKDPLLSMDTQSSRSWSSFPLSSKAFENKGLQGRKGEGEWSDMLDLMSRRKTETLAPEHLESVWAKGRNYKRKEGEEKIVEQVPPGPSSGKLVTVTYSNPPKDGYTARLNSSSDSANSKDHSQHMVENTVGDLSNYSSVDLYLEDEEQNALENTQTESSKSYTSEDEETDNATGLNSPGTRVWDGRTKRSLGASHIHHPLENSESHFRKKSTKEYTQYQESPGKQSGRKRLRQSRQNVPAWQEVERKSFLSGDGQDILSFHGHVIGDDASDDSDTEFTGRAYSGTTASSSGSYFSLPESVTVNALKSSLMVDSFAQLRCEVLGANIVKSSSRMFTVYSIAVTDENNHSWSIKRRFRHFEELHRRLKEFPEYNLHLPPKHFLSTGLDIPVIHERCISLDNYLKKLLQLPRVSGSLEVWDFLSVDSQTYAFSSSFSIIETFTVKPDHKPPNSIKNMTSITGPTLEPPISVCENSNAENGKPVLRMRNNRLVDDLKSKDVARSHVKTPGRDHVKAPDSDLRNSKESGALKVSAGHIDPVIGSGLPTEWVPPKLTLPLLDLVDVVFQLQEGGWIRRKAFWVAKQILQLGMGDALDDWLLEKIRLLRRGTVVASGIQRVEQIMWPDGIFITKHPKRQQQRAPAPASPSSSSYQGQQTVEASSPRLTEMEQQQEADRRAKFVYELMTDKAPAAIVSLVGHKEYEQCAKDLYFCLQSSVCLKQLAFNLLELLLLSAFPEMDQIFKQLHEEKHKFGEFKAN